MKRHLLVFEEGGGRELDLKAFVETLDDRAQIYTLEHHICFVKSELSASEISDRFVKCAGSRLFFVADISSSPWAGRMVSSFWDYLKKPAFSRAAE